MSENKLGSYQFIRPFFEFALNWPPCKCQHIALYSWIVELNNRLKWKENFGLPTGETMEGLSIGNKSTYYNALRDLEKWQLIRVIKQAKNQHQSCVISLCRNINVPSLLNSAGTLSHSHRTGTDTGTVPICNIDKSILQKSKKIKKSKEGEKIALPDLNLIFLFFKKESNWPNEKCTLISKKFILQYEGNKDVILEWEKKAKIWILTDRPELVPKNGKKIVTASASYIPVSVYPDYFSVSYAEKKLSAAEYDDYISHLYAIGKLPVYNDEGKIIDFLYRKEIEAEKINVSNPKITNMLSFIGKEK